MDNKARISAIIPAYNEEQTIGTVLNVLTSFPGFSEVIVVSDGSTDNTVGVARAYGARCINLPTNVGKGAAMAQGVAQAQGNIIFFCDADVRGLTHDALAAVLAPVIHRQAMMCVGVRGRNVSWLTRLLAHLFPHSTLIAGERALTRQLWHALPAEYKQGFRVELGLNYLADHQSPGLTYVALPQLHQTIKEQKYGLKYGWQRRMSMLRQMITTVPVLIFDRRLKVRMPQNS